MRPSRVLAALLLANLLPALLLAEDDVHVTCGSAIKLEHDATKHLLHSHEVAYGYGRSSGQQSVTGYPERDSSSSLWIVRSGEGPCAQGTPVKHGQLIRLQHMATRRWLHSHLFHSPLSNNQEVSCFGDDHHSDQGDHWKVEVEGGLWGRDGVVRFKHQETGAYLASHSVKYQRPIQGHTEIFAAKHRMHNGIWRATEGVYFSQQKGEGY